MRCAFRLQYLTRPNGLGYYPMLWVKSNDNEAWLPREVKWPLPRQYQRRSLTIVRITRTSRTAVARWKSSSMSITITPTITITNENHHWLYSCCHLQPKLSNSSPGSVAVASVLTWEPEVPRCHLNTWNTTWPPKVPPECLVEVRWTPVIT